MFTLNFTRKIILFESYDKIIKRSSPRLGKSPSLKSYVSPAQEIDVLKVKSVSGKDSWSKYFQTVPIHHYTKSLTRCSQLLTKYKSV